jgi:hypothetical protein
MLPLFHETKHIRGFGAILFSVEIQRNMPEKG